MIGSMIVHRKDIRKQNLKMKKKLFQKNNFFTKTDPKIVSMILHRKDNRKQNSKREKLFSLEKQFHKKLFQRHYQWGYTGEILKCKT